MTKSRSLLVRFESGSTPLNVTRFNAERGIVFDTHPDASPLNVGIGMQPRLPKLLEPVRNRNGWQAGEFRLHAEAASGGLRLSGYAQDPKNLPAGIYDVSFEVESYTFTDAFQTVEIPKSGEAQVTLHEQPDPREVKLHENFDPDNVPVLKDAKSLLDGNSVRDWLDDGAVRENRKACLLNVLAKLLAPRPAPAAGNETPLTDEVRHVCFADVDRIYAAVRPELSQRMEVLKASKLWVKEKGKLHPTHERLKDFMVSHGIITEDEKKRYRLVSYRQGGRNCLQIVLAIPPEGFRDPTLLYADIDIDLGNPLWDIEGLVVHLGEVLDSGRTDHLKLHDKLLEGEAAKYVYYDVDGAKAAHA